MELTKNPLLEGGIAPKVANPLLVSPENASPARSVRRIEIELASKPHLATDLQFARRQCRQAIADARQAKSAAEVIGRLPDPDGAAHLVIGGRFALWDFVPAARTLAGVNIQTLHIATLGFSKRNIEALCAMIDAGAIGLARLLCSHYFAGTSPVNYAFAVEELAKRPGRADFLSVRTHAKILLLEFVDGRRLTVESSANLRSCKNIEQASMFGSPELHAFHRDWIDSLFRAAANE